MYQKKSASANELALSLSLSDKTIKREKSASSLEGNVN